MKYAERHFQIVETKYRTACTFQHLLVCHQSHEIFSLLQLDTNGAHDFRKTGEEVHLQDQQTLHLEEKGKALESNKHKWP
jgi:hypothetical protein